MSVECVGLGVDEDCDHPRPHDYVISSTEVPNQVILSGLKRQHHYEVLVSGHGLGELDCKDRLYVRPVKPHDGSSRCTKSSTSRR